MADKDNLEGLKIGQRFIIGKFISAGMLFFAYSYLKMIFYQKILSFFKLKALSVNFIWEKIFIPAKKWP
jgi:hypothetical protein